MYASVVVKRPLFHRPPAGADPVRADPSTPDAYTYRLPEPLAGTASVGHLVQVPLRAGTALGVVVELADTPPAGLPLEAIRDVSAILDPLPVVTPLQIELARSIAHACFEPLSQAVRLMLPPELEARTQIVVRSVAGECPEGLTAEERAALDALRRHKGRMRLGALLEALPAADGEAVVDALADRGLVEASHAFVPPQPAPPRVQYVRLLADGRTVRSALPRLGAPSKQADALWAVAWHAGAPLTLPQLCDAAGCTPAPVKALAARGWVEITRPRTLLVVAARDGDPLREGAGAGGRPAAGHTPRRETAARSRRTALLDALRAQGGVVELDRFRKEAAVRPADLAALEAEGDVRRVVEPPLVLLKVPAGQVLDLVVNLRGAEKERAVLEALAGSTGRVWVGGLYAQTGATVQTLHRLAERGLISLHAEELERPSLPGPQAPPPLTAQQSRVWQEVERGLGLGGEAGEPFAALLHGVTGSGKTEIYLRAIEAVLAAGRRAIVLVPEISLTSQTVRRFEARFPGRVALLHSQLSLGQRYAVWDQMRRGQRDILIGPRSALFAPVSRLGLIVVDEMHEPAYKQDDPIPLPPYDARDVALALARLAGAALLMGSATPDLVHYHRATQGAYRLLELPQRVAPPPVPGVRPGLQSLPVVRVVDLRQELRAGNRSILSRALQDALGQALAAQEQAILFLNRRGTATFVLCRDCGYVVLCPRCGLPLTLHMRAAERGPATSSSVEPAPGALPAGAPRGSAQRGAAPAGAAEAGVLVCHRCNYREPAPVRCPKCGKTHIRFFGLGTERVEAAVRQLYPGARVLRWDRDTASGLDHERYLEAFVSHQADVLVGTQMIAKGLDLPLVTLVGVISADTALNLPDFRAAERTFQLLAQVAGRAGRGRRAGQAIVQTYNPDHYAVQAAARHDFGRFAEQELAYRRRIGYPPFSRLVALRHADEDPRRCRAEAERMGKWLRAEIRRLGLPDSLIGPAPCFYSRLEGRYRWQILLRTPDPAPLLGGLVLPWGWRVDVDPVSVL